MVYAYLFLVGIVLGSFFYGYWALQIAGAWIALKLGGTRVFGYGVLLAALLALLTPVAARYHAGALIGVRVLQGLFLVGKILTFDWRCLRSFLSEHKYVATLFIQGVSYPCNHAIWSKWSPVSERSTLVTAAIAGKKGCMVNLHDSFFIKLLVYILCNTCIPNANCIHALQLETSLPFFL